MIKVGDRFKNKTGDWGEVLEYVSSEKVFIKFDNTESEKWVSSGNLRKGAFKDNHRPNVCGVGFYGTGDYKAKINGRDTPAYTRWIKMIHRCHNLKVKSNRPSYEDATVCDEWLNFQNYAKWFYNHPYLNETSVVDKDLKVKGNKLYSPETCLVIPYQINDALTLSGKARGNYPVGVIKRSDRKNKPYGASLTKTIDGVKKSSHLGYFQTPEEAFLVYKTEKELYIKSLAERFKDVLDPIAYNALLTYTISEED